MVKVLSIIIVSFIIIFVIWLKIREYRKVKLSDITLYFGAIGSGKTMFLTKLAVEERKRYKTIYSNYPLNVNGICKFDKDSIGEYDFGENTLCLFDEGSINGFDNRDFKSNFKNNNALPYFKLVRHYKTKFVFSNQGWDELDKKIKTITQQYYLVKKFPIYSVAIRVYRTVGIDELTHEIVDMYKFPSLPRILFDSSVIQIVRRKKYGKYYNSWEKEPMQEIKKETWIDE